MPPTDDPPSPKAVVPPEDDVGTRPTLISSGVYPALVNPEDTSLDDADFQARYQLGHELGHGGMGEVRLCRDVRLGRTVALKVVRPDNQDEESLARFLREARVQGQLEHPAIVPVYDLGRRSQPGGEPYFTMKRVKGQTLADILDGLARADPEMTSRYTRHKLLAAFQSVCLAVDFAHARGVVHRDLKPQNIMLGDYGEVYVLDWGLAKLLKRAEGGSGREVVSDATTSGATVAGAMLGTPGYMSPEQMGSPTEVDARTDVYALGAILFEILSGRPLHAGNSVAELIHSTAQGVDARALLGSITDVAPELAELCARAVAPARDQRLGTARELHTAIEQHLEGQRDVTLRREMAASHANAAVAAAQRASEPGSIGIEARREALRDVGRALALDPSNATAMKTFVNLLAQAPRELPEEARAELEAAARKRTRRSALLAIVTFSALFFYAPVFWWMGIRNGLQLGAVFGSIAITCLSAAMSAWRFPTQTGIVVTSGFTALVVGCASFIAGPYIVVPSFAAILTTAYAMESTARSRPLVIAMGMIGFLIPGVLELVGVGHAAYSFGPEGMTVLPRMVGLPPIATKAFLLLSGFTTIGFSAVVVGMLRDSLTEAEKRLVGQAWQLRQLVS